MRDFLKDSKDIIDSLAEASKARKQLESNGVLENINLDENNNDKYKWSDINKALSASGLKPWQISSILRKLKGKEIK